MNVLRVVGQSNPRSNLLQARFGKKWETIDTEIIPEHAVMSKGCFGDSGNWKSRFISIQPVFER